ncbi:MAG: DEAD/DEAH box helicase, partial [Candidatus Thermoplasmatota archaeon]|nr:DEAD/DEAH box helicase [Candidatus Thermoplasmatota archaeon]
PEDPDEVVLLARKDEDTRGVFKAAIRRFNEFGLNHPKFKHRVEGDVRFLKRAMDRFAPEKPEPEQEADPVKQEVSRMLKGVPADQVMRARNLLLELHEVAGVQQAGEAPRAEVPDPIPGFLGKLRPYQEEGVSFLLGRELNAVLADDMGLGKTVMTIAAVLAADTRALVVAPANVLYNWAAEIQRFTGEQAAIWHGRTWDGNQDARFLVTTYDSLRLYDWRRTDAGERPALVLDEAHMVRNPETQRSRMVKDLPQEHRILLTGTPVVNGLPDYYQLLSHVGDTKWASQQAFEETWLQDKQALSSHPKVRQAVADLLQRATRHVVMRRRKDDVLEDLPERTITVDQHVLDDEQEKTYQALEAEAQELMASTQSDVKVFAHLHKLRQHLIEARLPLVRERIQELLDAGEAVVVYAHYLDPLRELEDQLDGLAARLDGSTPPRQRERLAKQLGEPDGPQVLLAQIEAGGVGLNFTGARYVLFIHLGWTAAIHKQAIDRVHRIGQDRPVQVEFFVSPGTIDERMADIILRKEADANLVLLDEGDVLNRAQLARALLQAPGGGEGDDPNHHT